LRAEVRLKLLEEHKHERYTILLLQLLKRGVFEVIEVQVQLSIALKDVWLLIQHIFEVVSQNQGSTLVLVA